MKTSAPYRPVSDEKRADSRRKHRARPTPKWLLEKQELEEVARRRCLMVLEVLSGAKAVTDVVEGGQISRATYYKLEERALGAMLRALSPTAGPDGTDAQALASAQARVAELEEKLAGTEKEKRRADKLYVLTKKLIKPGALTTASGRPPGSRNRPKSMTDGPKPSPASKSSGIDPTTGVGVTPLTPNAAGASGR